MRRGLSGPVRCRMSVARALGFLWLRRGCGLWGLQTGCRRILWGVGRVVVLFLMAFWVGWVRCVERDRYYDTSIAVVERFVLIVGALIVKCCCWVVYTLMPA